MTECNECGRTTRAANALGPTGGPLCSTCKQDELYRRKLRDILDRPCRVCGSDERMYWADHRELACGACEARYYMKEG